ncbi:hypothetical protein [Brachybacterium sp. 107]|uniref:hypothetical protein n=1 Tax=Brachybacterium sp. 107 TaxID=3457736 RepID=UPI00403482B3
MEPNEHVEGATAAVINSVLEHLYELGVQPGWRHGMSLEGRLSSGILTVDAGAGVHEFPAVGTAIVSPAELTLLPHDETTILLTRHITTGRAESLAGRGWGGYADSTGNASLCAPGMVIGVTGKRDTGAGKAPPATPFTRAGLPVTFALLMADEQGGRPRQRELAGSSGASIGTVNRVIRALRERNPPMLDESNQVLRSAALEDEWVAAHSTLQPRVWPKERFTSDIWKDPSDLIPAQLSDGALLGSELAAAHLGAPIRPSGALVHLPPEARGPRPAGRLSAEAASAERTTVR